MHNKKKSLFILYPNNLLMSVLILMLLPFVGLVHIQKNKEYSL